MKALRRFSDGATTLRFVIVGVGAAVLLFFLSWLFVAGGMSPFAGSALAYAFSFVAAYSAQRNWTFGGNHGHGHALPRYFMLQAGCAFSSGLIAQAAVAGFGASPLIMSGLTVIGASAASYIGSVLWVFPQPRRAR
jgi:putative flippase GtrA